MPVSAYADRSFAAGDLVIARRNDYSRGLINGQRGTVTAVDPDAGMLTVELGGGTTIVPALTSPVLGSITATPSPCTSLRA